MHRKQASQEASEDLRMNHYLDLRYLSNLNTELAAKKSDRYTQIPFHHVMAAYSPLYAQTMRLHDHLGMELKPALKTMLRLYLEFDPFAMELEYPKTKDNIQWILNFTTPALILDEFTLAAKFNWSVFHDAFHLILIRLIPCKKPSDLEYYFHFFESFVGVQEAWLTRELGSSLYEPLKTIGLLSDAPEVKEYPGAVAPKAMREFLMFRFMQRFMDKPKNENRNKKWIARNEISREWFKRYSKTHKKYPAALGKKTVGKLQRFEMPSFNPSYLAKNPLVMDEFFAWYLELIKTPLK